MNESKRASAPREYMRNGCSSTGVTDTAVLALQSTNSSRHLSISAEARRGEVGCSKITTSESLNSVEGINYDVNGLCLVSRQSRFPNERHVATCSLGNGTDTLII